MAQALVIGIDHYDSPSVPNLQCAAHDANEVARSLAAAGFDVTTLLNEEATKDAIEFEVEVGLATRAGADDPVVVFWSGHGMSQPADKSDTGWSTFLLPHDARTDAPMGTAIPVQHLWALLSRLESRRLLVLLDACFSGAFTPSERGITVGSKGSPLPTKGLQISSDFLRLEGYGRAVVTACGPDEVAREDVRSGHGHFTKALLSVLGREFDRPEREIEVGLLATAVRDEVLRVTKGQQTPTLHLSGQGPDWTVPLPPPSSYRTPVPGWAFVGTSGGVGKTTLSMMTAELLAESGNDVLYLDADIAHFGGTSEWCQRSGTTIGMVRTFADHVARHSGEETPVPQRNLTDRLLDVTPEYLRRNGCGRILLLPAARPADQLFAFNLVAKIEEGGSNAACRKILDEAFDRGLRQQVACVVIDCGAQFDPLAVNAFAAADHPFIVAAARNGASGQRATILSNCNRTVDEFNELRVETVVNRVPSLDAVIRHWGQPDDNNGFRWLPFDRKLFGDWESGFPNFELGYDELTNTWHSILADSDNNSCAGAHQHMLPSEWDRLSKWALWILDNPGWAARLQTALTRRFRRTILVAISFILLLGGASTLLALGDSTPVPHWVSITAGVASGVVALGNVLGAYVIWRRRRITTSLIENSTTADILRGWFDAPTSSRSRWTRWARDSKVAIEWLHREVAHDRAQSGRILR